MDAGADFEETWNRIRTNKGEKFRTVRGLDFTYKMLGPWMVIDRTDYRITKKNFQLAYGMLPVDGPDGFGEEVTARYYVHAVLTDPRITG
jgi:hypothetical protein